jgi:hypothetical protein
MLQMQEELERGQTFQVPVVNVLHETAEAARTNSTYVQSRLAGEPRMGAPTNKQPDLDLDVSLTALGGNNSSYHTASTAETDGASVMYKPSADGGFNASTFGANSGIKPTHGLGYPSHNEASTALPTAASTADGNPASALDPLASLLGESEFSMGHLGVGFQSSVASAHPAHSNTVHHGGDAAPGVKKSNFGGFGAGNNNNHYSIDEEKSYTQNNSNTNHQHKTGALGTFDSYLGSTDNK